MNKVFLSSRFSRKGELLHLRTLLQLNGFEVCSRWLDTEWNQTERENEVYSSAAPPDRLEEYSQIDRDDVVNCDVFIGFTESPRSQTRGGRHVEFGIAVALKKKLIMVGPRENIFHSLPEVIMLPETVNNSIILSTLKDIVKA